MLLKNLDLDSGADRMLVNGSRGRVSTCSTVSHMCWALNPLPDLILAYSH